MNERVVMYHMRFNGLAIGYVNIWIHKRDMVLETMATHHLTMISRVKLLQLIHVDGLRKLIFVQICQLGGSLLSQLSDNIRPAPTWSKLALRVTNQSPEGLQD